MIVVETLHARPLSDARVSPCCGRTVDQLPPYDRIAAEADLVTCGHLSVGTSARVDRRPEPRNAEHERTVFAIAAAVASTSQGAVTVPRAFDNVHRALRQLAPTSGVPDVWTAALMVEVTALAQELCR